MQREFSLFAANVTPYKGGAAVRNNTDNFNNTYSLYFVRSIFQRIKKNEYQKQNIFIQDNQGQATAPRNFNSQEVDSKV